MPSLLRATFIMFTALTLLCGVAYPFAMTGIGRLAFPQESGGSIVLHDGRPVGSALIGQAFSAPRYFWGRPSATAPAPYHAAASAGANQGPTNPALIAALESRIAALRTADPDNAAPVPVDLVTASASGLDPDISLAAAYYQAARVARARKMAPEQVHVLIEAQGKRRVLGLFGEPRVNVLALNLALDRGDR
jgi:K+-transporting ATPase ATPase C chain